MSILPFYFPSSRISSPTLRLDSLVVSLHLMTSLGHWLIRISGTAHECSFYLQTCMILAYILSSKRVCKPVG